MGKEILLLQAEVPSSTSAAQDTRKFEDLEVNQGEIVHFTFAFISDLMISEDRDLFNPPIIL